jgi:tetratricopeptide (TPR) repeat protein
MVWMVRSERDRALADFNQAVALGDPDGGSHTARGQMWLSENDLDRAIADFTEALRRDSKQAAAWRDRGLAWFFKNDFEHALTDLNEAIRLNPADAVAFNNRGAARLRAGSYAEAQADLTEAVRLNPKFPNPYKHLAWLQATCTEPKFRDGTAAVANVTRALELADWKPVDWFAVLAAAHAEAGNFEEATKWQTKCLDESPPEHQTELRNTLGLYQARRPLRAACGLAARR